MDVINPCWTFFATGAGSTCIVYSHLWNAMTQETHELLKLFWLDPYMLWELWMGHGIIWSLKPWLFESLLINYPRYFLNLLHPIFLEVAILGFTFQSNALFHLTVIFQILPMVIYWYKWSTYSNSPQCSF